MAYDIFKSKLDQLREDLKSKRAKILLTDKGSGLIILSATTVNKLYQLYLEPYPTITIYQTVEFITQIRTAIHNYDHDAKTLSQDDRTLTFYFRIKAHKTDFPFTEYPPTG